MKVYCKKCKWLSKNYNRIYGDVYVCINPLLTREKDTPLEIVKEYCKYKEINADNNCKGYTKRKWTIL
jgi:hypothetical protein